MAMTPKQMKAYLEKLAKERREQEARARAAASNSSLSGLGIGTPGATATVVIADDDWMRDLRNKKKDE